MSKGRLCLYCGNPTGKVRKGDHLIPDAIGGTVATKDVCPKCNNELSDIDRELCSRSPLCIVASHEIDGHIAQAWDVDESNRNLLLEGRSDLARSSFRIFPQMIVMPRGEELRADWHELRVFGLEKFQPLFKRRLRKAFWEYEHGNKKALIFSELPYNNDLLTRYTHFPRFFVRGTVAEACSTKTIELGYASRAAKRMAMARVEAGLHDTGEMRSEIGICSQLPTIRCFCDGGKVWRALAKMAVNLLHHFCRRTEVNLLTFPRVIDEIRGKRKFHPIRLSRSGFVCHTDVATIASADGSHTIRLSWEKGFWNAAMAFFGGQIGAAVKFPGPNKETWRTLGIKAPINSSDWTVTPSSLVIPSRFTVEWGDLNKMIASGGFIEVHSDKFEA